MFRMSHCTGCTYLKKIVGSFQFIGISNTNYGNRVNESKTADSRNRCEIIDEFCPVANEQKMT